MIHPENQRIVDGLLAKIKAENAKAKPNRAAIKQWFYEVRTARGDEHVTLPQASHTQSKPLPENHNPLKEAEDSKYIRGESTTTDNGRPDRVINIDIAAQIDGTSANEFKPFADLVNRLLQHLVSFMDIDTASPERRTKAMAVALCAAAKCINPDLIQHRTDEEMGERIGVQKAAINRAVQMFRDKFPEIERNPHFRSEEAKANMSKAKNQLTSTP
jgi:hypothetical protein